MSIYICSIDIGKKNFAFCIEKVNTNILNSIKDIPLSKRYKIDGSPTPEYNEILSSVFHSGKLILLKNCNLTKNCEKSKYLDPEVFHNLTELLISNSKYLDKCSYFIIEQQMSFGRNKINTMALKIGQHCFSYFVFTYGKFKRTIEFPAYYKTQILGAPKVQITKKNKTTYKHMDKPARKKWSIVKAAEIIKLRKEMEAEAILAKSKKKDDFSDVICQLQAFKYLYFVNKMKI